MNLRHAIIIGISVFLLSACNFTLAADVTPPPDYVAPTPMPTLGPLFPASAPDINNGAAIYVEKCAPCHGDTGLGDGEQGQQLPVTVAAFALPETAHKASPASWFTMVSQGNLDRFMPPFTSLGEQERWDVVSYALTLHTTPEQIETGKNLFESSCADCAEKFSDQKMMSALSDNELVRMIRNGEGDIPAFGGNFTDDEAFAVAAYLRTLTFALPATPLPASVTGTLSTSIEGAAQPEVTREAMNVAGLGKISGSIDNQTGAALASDLKVTLRGYEHGADTNASPQEIATFDITVNPDGMYYFGNIEIPENRIFRAEINLDGIIYQSEFVVVEAGTTELVLPPITVYATTDDYSVLRVDALQMYFDFANEQNVQILAVYSFTNTSDKTVVVKLNDAQEIPFIKMPNNTAGVGYEASPDSAPFIQFTGGLAMRPSETPYGLIAFATLPKAKRIEIEQPAVLPIAEVMLLVPEGVTAEGETLVDNGPHEFQGGNFILYTSAGLKADESVSFTLSGEPKNTAVAPNIMQNQSLLIGVGALGMLLILAGAWMYWRDRKRTEAEDQQESDLEDPESIMDAIIALDDLHRAGKLSDQAYKQRRAELKNILIRKS